MYEIEYTKNQDIIFHGINNPLKLNDNQHLPLGVTPTHAYVFTDGTICKSVTQVLVNQNLNEDFSLITGNAKIIADEAAEFGSIVHGCVENYIKSCNDGNYTFDTLEDICKLNLIINELIPDKYNESRTRHNIKGNIEKIADKYGKILTWGESVFEHASYILRKISSFNLLHAYPEQILALRQPIAIAGTSDLIGVKQDGSVVIVDYKTGNHVASKEEMQVKKKKKMLEINTCNSNGEMGVTASELITINSKEQECYNYQIKKTSLIADILLAEKENKKLSEVVTCPTKGLEILFNSNLAEACDKKREYMLMRANFLSEFPEFEEQYNIYNNLISEEDKTSKKIKEAIIESGITKVNRPDFDVTLSYRDSKQIDYDKLQKYFPEAYKECVKSIKTPILYVTPNQEFIKEQSKTKNKNNELVI